MRTTAADRRASPVIQQNTLSHPSILHQRSAMFSLFLFSHLLCSLFKFTHCPTAQICLSLMIEVVLLHPLYVHISLHECTDAGKHTADTQIPKHTPQSQHKNMRLRPDPHGEQAGNRCKGAMTLSLRYGVDTWRMKKKKNKIYICSSRLGLTKMDHHHSGNG